MKFGEFFHQTLVEEWKSNYIDYEVLKSSIDNIISLRPGCEQNFITQLNNQIEKANQHYTTSNKSIKQQTAAFRSPADLTIQRLTCSIENNTVIHFETHPMLHICVYVCLSVLLCTFVC